MRNKMNLIEPLENRKLFAAGLTLGPNNLYFNAVKGKTQTYDVRVTNTGDSRVLLERFAFVSDTGDASQFKVVGFSPRSLGVGVQINVTVQFTAPSTYDKDISTATLRAYSNVPSRNGFANVIPIRAMTTKGTSDDLEPSLQKIFNLYNLPIDSGETDPENYKFPSTPSSTSDEVIAPTFVKAGSGQVSITPLGVFTNPSSPSVRMGYYTPGEPDSGNYLWYVPTETSQSVNPFYYGQSKFDPGTAEFGLMTEYPNFYNNNGTVRKVYSENTLNRAFSDSSTYRHFRVYPFVNQQGKLVENAYIVAQEEYGITNVADNNDLLFVVSNVKIAGATPTLEVDNPQGLPGNNTVVFNKVQIPDQYVTNLVRDTNKIIVRNSGLSNLVVSIAVTGEYSITSGGGSNISIAPGEKHEVTVKFTTTNATGDKAFRQGALTITSNDPAKPTKSIALRGVWTRYSEQQGPGKPSVEATAQEVINDIFGYTTVIPGKADIDNEGNTQQKGDEILAQYFTAADSLAYVQVTEIAALHNQTYLSSGGENLATNSYMGWYQKGNTGSYKLLTKHKAGAGQMILPTPETSNSAGVTTKGFRPDSATQVFGFVVEKRTADASGGGGEYSDRSLNTWAPPLSDGTPQTRSSGQFLRFFPLKNADGELVPNTYIMLHDYNRGTTNYDFNDNIFIISNIVPEGQVKAPAIVNAVRNSEGVRVFLSSPADGPKVAGFNVYRSTTPTGVYALLNGTPLPAKPSNLWQDSTAAAGTTYYYAVETVGTSGAKSDRVTIKV